MIARSRSTESSAKPPSVSAVSGPASTGARAAMRVTMACTVSSVGTFGVSPLMIVSDYATTFLRHTFLCGLETRSELEAEADVEALGPEARGLEPERRLRGPRRARLDIA